MTPTPLAVWVRPKPDRAGVRADAGLAILLAIAASLTAMLYQRMELYEDPAPLWLSAIGIGLCTLPLALRRRYPVLVAVVVSLGFFVCGQFRVPEVLIINVCLFTALYTVGAWAQDRRLAFWTRFGVTAAMLVWVVIALIISSSDPDIYPAVPRSGIFSAYATFAVLQIITNLMYFIGAFLFGERAWRGARTNAQLEAQGRELELERQTSAAQAVALDRVAIARELHDVVAHHVSVMGIQAAAARRMLVRDPDRAAQSLELVEENAHTAVEELRRLVHTLRAPEADGESTTVGIAQLGALVAESQSAGLPTTLIVAGEARPLPLLVDVALYRVVQEALTNARKHAGRGATAEVRLRFTPEFVEVEVIDDGVRQKLGSRVTASAANSHHSSVNPTPFRAPSTIGSALSAGASGGSGLGLRGMRERIGAVGGTVTAGRRERGGFMVRATVPLSAAPQSAAPLSTAPPQQVREDNA